LINFGFGKTAPTMAKKYEDIIFKELYSNEYLYDLQVPNYLLAQIALKNTLSKTLPLVLKVITI
jgi:hypothetical protein